MSLKQAMREFLVIDREPRTEFVNALISTLYLDTYPASDPHSPMNQEVLMLPGYVRNMAPEERRWLMNRLSSSLYFDLWVEKQIEDHQEFAGVREPLRQAILRQIDEAPEFTTSAEGVRFGDAWDAACATLPSLPSPLPRYL